MPRKHKPSKLLVIWNKDHTLSVYPAGGGARLVKCKIYSWDHEAAGPGGKVWLEAVSAFCEGWFGTDDRAQWRVTCKVAK